MAPREAQTTVSETRLARAAGRIGLATVSAAMITIAAFGGTGAYISMALSLLLLIVVAGNGRWLLAQDTSFTVIFAVAFLLFAALVLLPVREEGSALYMFDFSPLILAIALYVGLGRVGKRKLLTVFAASCLIGSAVSLAVGAYQVFGLDIRRANGFGNSAITYANISLLLGFLAVAPFFAKGRAPWYLAIGPFMGVGAAILSGSRSIVPVGLALAIVLSIHLLILAKWRARHWAIAAVAIAVAAGFLAVLLATGYLPQGERIVAMAELAMSILGGADVGDRSISYRFDYYQGGLAAFLASPLLGYGWHEAAFAAAPYMTVFDPREITVGGIRHLHNDLLQFAVSLGVGGAVLYFTMLAAPVIAWLRSTSREVGPASYCVFAISLSFFAMGLTNTNFVYEAPKVMFCFAAAVAAALAAGRRGLQD